MAVTAALDVWRERVVGSARAMVADDHLTAKFLTAGVVATVFWPTWALVPQVGLDPSWRVGLAWAARDGMQWGPDISFTYGPLAYLAMPQAAPRWQLLLASLVWITAAALLVAVTYALVRSRFGARPLATAAATFACVAIFLVLGVNSLVPVAMGLAVLAFRGSSWLPVVLTSVVLGLLGQEKLIDAAAAGTFCLFVSLAGGGIKRAAGLLVLSAGAFVVAWILAGQALVNLPSHLRGIYEVVSGYSSALSLEPPQNRWHYLIAVPIGLAIITWVYMASRALGRRQRLTLLLGVVATMWLAFKEGFVRHDGHAIYFFGLCLLIVVLVVLAVAPASAMRSGAALALACYLAAAAIAVPFLRPIDRQPSLNALGSTLAALASPMAAGEMLSQASRDIAQAHEITPELRSALGAAPTVVDPWDISALAATDAVWRPVPSLQMFSAYTPELDARNVASLVGDPRQVLRRVAYGSIDGRNPYWDSPTYQLLLYCSYASDARYGPWLILRPVSNVCGPPEEVLTVDAAPNVAVPVPSREGSVTLVTIRPHYDLAHTVMAWLFKSGTVGVTYGGTRWRLAHTPDAVGLMLNAPLSHEAFANLPALPHGTLTVSTAAQLEFQFASVTARP